MWEKALMAAAPEFAKGLGSALGGGSPGTAVGKSDPIFDSSGWNVAFNGDIDAEANKSQAGNFDQYMPYVLAAAGVLIVWRLTKKR